MQSQAYRMPPGEALFHREARKMQYHYEGEQLYRDPHPHQHPHHAVHLHRHLVHTDDNNNNTLLVHPQPVHRVARHKSLLTHAHDTESDHIYSAASSPSRPAHFSGDEAPAHHSLSHHAASHPSSQTTPSSLPAHPHPLYKSMSPPSRFSPSFAARREKESSRPSFSFGALPSPPLQSDAHPSFSSTSFSSSAPPPPPQLRRTLPSTHFPDRPTPHFAHRPHRCLCLLPFVESNTPAMGATMYGTPASNDDGQGQGRNDCHHDHIEKGQQHFDQWLNENVNVEGDVDGHDIVDLENQHRVQDGDLPRLDMATNGDDQGSPNRTISTPSTPASDPPMALTPSVHEDDQHENHNFRASTNGNGNGGGDGNASNNRNGYVYTSTTAHQFPHVPQTNVSPWSSDGDVFTTPASTTHNIAPISQGNGLNPLAHQFVPDLGYISNGFPPVYPPTVTTAFTSIPTTYAYAYDQRAVPHNTFVPPVYQPMQHQYSAPMMPMMPTMQTSHPGHGAISRLGYANGSGLNPTAAPFFFPNMTPRTMAPAPLHYDQDFDYAFNGYMPTLGDGVNDSTTLRPLNASQRKRPRLDDDDQDEHSVAVPPAKKAKIGTENNGEVGVPGEVTKLDYDEFLNFTPSKDGNVTDASRNSQQQADLTRPVDTTFEPVHLTRPFTPLHHNSPDLQRTTVSPKDLQVVADQVVQSSEPVESYDEPGVVHSMSQWHSHGNQFEEDYGHLPATGLQSFNHPIAGQAIVDLHRPSYNYPSPLIPSESFIPAGHSHHITHTSYRAPEPNMGDSQPTECRSSSSTNASTRRQATRRSTTTSNSSRSRSRYTSDEESEARRQRDELFVQLKDSGLGYKEIKERMGLTEADSTLRGRYRALKKDKKDRVRRPVWSDVDDAVLRSIIEEKTAAQGGPLNLIKISYKLVQEEMGAAGRYRFGYAALKKRAERLFKNSGNGATEADETDSQATEPASTEADQDLAGNTGVGSNVNDPYVV